MRSIAEAAARMEMMIDRADEAWQRPCSAPRRMTDEERTWGWRQSLRLAFVELYGRADGERRFSDHMAAAERGALQ